MTVRTLDSRPTIIIHVGYQSLRCLTSFQNGHRNLSELRWRDYHAASSSTLFPAQISGSPHGGKPLGGGLAGTLADWLRWTKIREEHLQWQGHCAYLLIQKASLTCLKRTVAEGRQQCFFPLLASLIINLGELHWWESCTKAQKMKKNDKFSQFSPPITSGFLSKTTKPTIWIHLAPQGHWLKNTWRRKLVSSRGKWLHIIGIQPIYAYLVSGMCGQGYHLQAKGSPVS